MLLAIPFKLTVRLPVRSLEPWNFSFGLRDFMGQKHPGLPGRVTQRGWEAFKAKHVDILVGVLIVRKLNGYT